MADVNSGAILESATDAEMSSVMRKLLEAEKIPVKVVSNELRRLRAGFHQVVKDVSATEEKRLSAGQQDELLGILTERWERGGKIKLRGDAIKWADVLVRLKADPEKMWSLYEMERTGGEPALCGYSARAGSYVFIELAEKCPRTNVCYNRRGQEEAERKGSKPAGNAVDMAAAMGIKMILPKDYAVLNEKTAEFGVLPCFDKNTRTWLETRAEMCDKGLAYTGAPVLFIPGVIAESIAYHSDTLGFRGWLEV